MPLNNKQYPPVVVVDEKDNEIGVAALAEVWQKGLYHRIVSVFVVDDRERVLLQLRSPQVKIYPNCWDQAASGHVDAGQTYEQAAANELAEEVGLRGVKLETLGTFRSNNHLGDGRIINQFERVYKAAVPHGTAVEPDSQEVSKLQWFTAAELKARIAQNPEAFTPGLLQALRIYSLV